MGTEKILDKIKKLIKKQVSSEEIGSTAEAEIFAAKVQELLAKHNLEIAQINLEEDKESDDVIEEYMNSMLPTIGGKSAFDILFPIAKFNWCHVYTFGNRSRNKMGIFGTAENVEICQYIYSIVSKVFIKECKLKYQNYVDRKLYILDRKTKPVGYDTFARSFMKGAGMGLHAKLKEERRKFESQNEKAGAIIKMNDVAIKFYIDDKFGGAGQARRVRQHDNGGALSQGYRTGREVSISQGLGTKKSKPIKRELLE